MNITSQKINSYTSNIPNGFQIQNRRFLGNKYKLLDFIEEIIDEKCQKINSFCDIFAGTGVVGDRLNKKNIKVISNDLLYSNYINLKTFLDVKRLNMKKLNEKIDFLNNLEEPNENYFSKNFGGTYFTKKNARKIGKIRETINEISKGSERDVLLSSLMYATDKVANTVGHYDAYRKDLDMKRKIKLFLPNIKVKNNFNNEIYNEDANSLIRKIHCDVLYIDPPYNSRQYCDSYHLLENLALWEKPSVFGKAKKMNRSNLKSKYCLKDAAYSFEDLIKNANCKHILVSYNNTGEKKHSRSNSRIKDRTIIDILNKVGKVGIYERVYKAFSAGKSKDEGHAERIFYCEVKK